jgi:hypothetical protein
VARAALVRAKVARRTPAHVGYISINYFFFETSKSMISQDLPV